MKTILSSRRHCLKRVGIFLIMAALIVGPVGCVGRIPILWGMFAGGWGTAEDPCQITNWYHLNNVGSYLCNVYSDLYGPAYFILMNDLDATTAGYEALASPTANDGRGWEPIGTSNRSFRGIFDGQGYEIRDLFVDRPAESRVGLFGATLGTRIENVGMVNASVTGKHMVGGLLGEGSKTTVRKSYFNGDVTGSEAVGGLAGAFFIAGPLEDSYSTGSVTGDEYVGGLVGKGGDVRHSYATASVSGNSYVGGLVGGNAEDVSNSFWDTKTSGQATSDGGTGKTTAEMQDIATFSGAGWNIIAVANPSTRNLSYIWNIVDDETYPFLSWQPV